MEGCPHGLRERIRNENKDNKHYIGFSKDLRERFKDHCNGEVISTRNRRPLKLIYYEAYQNEKKAREQELFYKTGQGRRVLKARLG